MTPLLYAYDTCFGDHAEWPPASRAELLQGLGFSGMAVVLTGTLDAPGLRETIRAMDRAGLPLVAVRLAADVAEGAPEPSVAEVAQVIAGRAAPVELSLVSTSAYDRPSGPRADARAAALIARASATTAAAGVPLALCPRSGNWLQRTEDAVRIAMRVNRADLGVTFGLLDWLCTDGEHLQARLELALPRLAGVSICGVGRTGSSGWSAVPLDEGTFGIATFLDLLDHMGYSGPIGLELPPAGNDPAEPLSRSLSAYRAMVRSPQRRRTPS